MRAITIRLIDALLDWRCHAICAVCLALAMVQCSPASTYTASMMPPYTREQLQEARPYVVAVISVGKANRHAVAMGFEPVVADGRISDYCGSLVLGCVVHAGHGGIIYLSPAAGASVLLHELGHVYDYWIAGVSWEHTYWHRGWNER